MICAGYKAMMIACFLCFVSGHVAKAQQIVKVRQGDAEKEILVLPHYTYDFDTTLVKKEEVNSGKPRKGKSAFKDQLSKVALLTAEAGGNVLMIKRMDDRNQRGNYKMWGYACHTDNYELLKTKAFAKKDKGLENGRYACVVLYRPEYTKGFNDETDMELTVNDTMHIGMKGSSKYMIQVPMSGNVKIATKDDVIVQHIEVKPGNTYYVRAYTNVPGGRRLLRVGESNVQIHGRAPYFEQIEAVQGELESSLITKITVMKKLGQ